MLAWMAFESFTETCTAIWFSLTVFLTKVSTLAFTVDTLEIPNSADPSHTCVTTMHRGTFSGLSSSEGASYSFLFLSRLPSEAEIYFPCFSPILEPQS